MAKTLFLSVPDIRKLISIVGFVDLNRQLGQRIIDDFRRWPEFDKSSRFASHSPAGVIELMPIADARRFSFKYVNGHPKNYSQNLPTVMGFGCLSEVSNGFPILLCEMTILTAIRTAATSAIAAQVLAKSNARTMALIGNGAQAEFQVLAFQALLGFDQFTLFDTDLAATERLMNNLRSNKSIQFRAFANVEAAIEGVEVITTATAIRRHQHVLTAPMISAGVHINAIGGDCPGKTELDPKILEMSKVFVEFGPQARIEGEIQQMTPDFSATELWEVFSGTAPGRTSDTDITVFDSVGFAIEDYSTLSLVYDLAAANSIGTEIDLIPAMEDVKDLYGSTLST